MVTITDKNNTKVELTKQELKVILNSLYTERLPYLQGISQYSTNKLIQIESIINKLYKLED